MAGNEARPHWQRLELIQRSALGPQQKLLLVWLWKYAGDNGHAFPRQEQLAADMGLSVRQVKRLIAGLSGTLSVTQDGVRNRYSICWDSLPDSVQAKEPRAAKKPAPKTQIGDTHVPNKQEEKGTLASPNGSGKGDTGVPNTDDDRGHSRPHIGDTGVPKEGTSTSPMTYIINSIETPIKLQCVLTGTPFPDELQSEAFDAAWREWHEYRRERRLPKWKPVTVHKQLNALARVGADAAVATLEKSIRNGWNGLFPEQQRQGKGQQTTQQRLQGLQQWADGGTP